MPFTFNYVIYFQNFQRTQIKYSLVGRHHINTQFPILKIVIKLVPTFDVKMPYNTCSAILQVRAIHRN